MPGLGKYLAELGVHIELARPASECLASKGDCRDASQFLKTKAMQKVVNECYRSPALSSPDGAPKKRSWKNIVSIGDSSAEQLALQDVVFRHHQRDRKGMWKECRCKTLKLVCDPDLEQLTEELHVITHWLPTLLHHDGDLDLDFEDIVDSSMLDCGPVQGENDCAILDVEN
jgi:hypothetical protein